MSDATPVRASDFLASVFARDEALVDIIAAHSPQLAKLRHSPVRRVMARVTTVSQAARLCGISAAALVAELNAALGLESAAGAGDESGGRAIAASDEGPLPPWQELGVVELDVREDLRRGDEPFSKIMAAVTELRGDQVLHLRTTFEPVPLFTVLGKRGFAHRALRHAADDWSVWFHRDSATEAVSEPEEPRMSRAINALTEMRIDVRGLEPPEPMLRTLEALEALPPACALMHVNVRVPRLLLPILRERGFEYQIDESRPGEVRVRIWRPPEVPQPDS